MSDPGAPRVAPRRRWLSGLLGSALLSRAPRWGATALTTATAGACGEGVSSHGFGSFMQPLLEDVQRSEVHWHERMKDWVDLGMRRLVLQHVALEPYDVLVPSPGPWRDGAGGRTLGWILDAAQTVGIPVTVGLSYDPRYWTETGVGDLGSVAAYLQRRRDRVSALAQALMPALEHPAFAGWYLSDEIDDLTWAAPDKQDLMKRWLSDVTSQLSELAPGRSLSLSGYAHSANTAPQALACQWAGWLDAAPLIEEVLLQDGIGAGNTTLETWQACLEAVRDVAQARRRRCTAVVELFALPPAGANDLRPAPPERIERQWAIAVSTTHAMPVVFSVPDYARADTAEGLTVRRWLLDHHGLPPAAAGAIRGYPGR